VSVGGKACGGKHRHAKCPMLPAAKAEKAAKAAVSGKSAAIFTPPGQDPGQAPAVMGHARRRGSALLSPFRSRSCCGCLCTCRSCGVCCVRARH
jgi:hypothetical protein